MGAWGGKEKAGERDYENEWPKLSFPLIYFSAVHSRLPGTNTCQQFPLQISTVGHLDDSLFLHMVESGQERVLCKYRFPLPALNSCQSSQSIPRQ